MNRAIVIGTLICALQTNSGPRVGSTQSVSADAIYVGFLDDAREEISNWQPGVPHQRLIRPAFVKFNGAWQLIAPSQLPTDMTWTIAFDGRNLGEIRSQTSVSKERHFLTDVQTILPPDAVVPSIGKPSQDFAGVMAGGPGVEVRRPLVLISKPFVSDPDGWHRLKIAPAHVAALVRSKFRQDFPHAARCKDEEVVKRDWRFPDSSLSLPATYASNKGSFLVEASLNAGNCGYIDDPDDPLADPWFLVSADQKVRRIGSFMSLLDAGDYDNDGRSELIFFSSQPEDFDGFLLFDANLKKQASFIWSYH